MTADSGERWNVLKRCILLAASVCIAVFCLDAAVFRSGYYKRFVTPDSSAGSVQQLIRIERERPLPFNRRVLVLGNSQLAEGFSAKTASKPLADSRINIVNAGVPGVTIRDWFYMVRDMDPRATRYNVIVFPRVDYADLDYGDVQANRIQDVAFLVGSLRLTDLATFSFSFPKWKDRWAAFRDSALEGLTYRDDVRNFLRAPKTRIAAMADQRLHGMEWQDGYNGLEQTLAGLQLDRRTGELHFPAGVLSTTQDVIRGRINPQPAAVLGTERAYARRWIEAVENHYRGRDVRFVFFRMPQYPIHIDLPVPDAASVVNTLGKTPRHIVMDEGTFDWLESPDYAADGIHLNRKGREAFSKALARELSRVLAGFEPKST